MVSLQRLRLRLDNPFILTTLVRHGSSVQDRCAGVGQVLVEVRGGKPVKLVIKGEAVLPAVDIQESQLDFGEVYTGVTARIPITLINTTPVLAGMSNACCCLLLCFEGYVWMILIISVVIIIVAIAAAAAAVAFALACCFHTA